MLLLFSQINSVFSVMYVLPHYSALSPMVNWDMKSLILSDFPKFIKLINGKFTAPKKDISPNSIA